VWAACAWLLLGTVVPDGLALPEVDVDRVFGRAIVEEGERYERFLYVLWPLSQVAVIVTLVVYAKRGTRFVAESAAGRIGTGMLLGMLGLAFVWLSQLPFGLAAHWWERRHELSDVGYLGWALENWALLAGEFLFVCLALLIVMALAGWLPRFWWIPGAAAFVALGALFAFVAPWLLATETEPLRDPALVAAADTFERDQGLDDVDIRIEQVSDETELANAYAAGYGPSRRVVLWDTLLNDFPEAEVEVVLAHELGHHSSDHILEGVAWYALFAVPGTYLLARLTRRRGGMGAPEAVPLALLVLAVLQLVALPAESWISRRMEAEADWKALRSTDDPAAARGLFRGFAETSLSDPDPPTWVHVVLGSHPTLAQRVAMAEAYRRGQAR
jgi:STE24 endopeptidase